MINHTGSYKHPDKFHFPCATERVLIIIHDFTENCWRFLAFLEGNGAYVPVQQKVYRDMIFIESKSQFTGIPVYRCTPSNKS